MKRLIVPFTVAVSTLAACAPAVSPLSQLPSALPADPFVNVGDELRITVWRDPEFTGVIEVGGDGRLAHPLYQSLNVARLPLSAVTQRIRDLLSVHQQDPTVLVELVIPVSVGGAVRSPSLYRVAYGTTIMDAVSEAGGAAERDQIFVARESDFDLWRDLVWPITSLGTLAVSIATLVQR
jgi:polysaccharide export outer membrane protein